MEPRVVSRYDPARNILHTEDYGDLRTPEQVDEFVARYKEILRQLERPAFIVSNIDHLRVWAEVAEYYGQRARETVDQYSLGFARWGTDSWARMTVRTTSLKAGMPTKIFDTRDEAVEEIERMKESSR